MINMNPNNVHTLNVYGKFPYWCC